MGRPICTLTIPTGAAASSWQKFDHVESLAIQAPAVVDAATTYKIQVSNDNGTTVFDLPSGAIVASQIVLISVMAYAYARVLASGNAAADRVFTCAGVEHFA